LRFAVWEQCSEKTESVHEGILAIGNTPQAKSKAGDDISEKTAEVALSAPSSSSSALMAGDHISEKPAEVADAWSWSGVRKFERAPKRLQTARKKCENCGEEHGFEAFRRTQKNIVDNCLACEFPLCASCGRKRKEVDGPLSRKDMKEPWRSDCVSKYRPGSRHRQTPRPQTLRHPQTYEPFPHKTTPRPFRPSHPQTTHNV
jgi:hypothetical protein